MTGAQGIPGIPGIPGERGERGERGEHGEHGEHGYQGDRGDRGPAGSFFNEGQEAIIERIVSAAVKEARKEFKEEVATAVIAGINDHRLKCESKDQVASIQTTLAAARGGLGVLEKIGVLIGGLGGLIGVAAAVWGAMRH